MKRIVFTLACLLSVTSVNAAPIGGVVPGNTPASINRQYQDQYKDLQIERKYIKTTPDDIENEKIRQQKQKEYEEELERQRQEQVEKIGMSYNPQFLLTKINFVGNTVIKDKKLQKLCKGFVGQEVYLTDVMDLTLKISRYYQEKGFITSFAELPAQEIVDGVVTINIIESRIGSKTTRGQRWTRDFYANRVLLGGRYMNEGDVFNAKALQGSIKNINKSDYMRGGIGIERNSETNITDISLDLQDRFPISFDVSVDDFGRDNTGRHRVTLIAGMDNLTGFGDRIYGGPILSDKTTGVMAGYQIPINSYGTKLGFDFSNTSMSLGGPYKDLGVKGKFTTYSINLTHPIINNATTDLIARVAYDFISTDTVAHNFPTPVTLSDYNLNVLRASLSGLRDDKYGRWLGSVGSDFGFSSNQNISGGPQGMFYKLVASAARVQRLPKRCLGIIRVNGQYSPQSLYAAEQMFIGGAYSIRGYQPAELLGDYGVAGSFEVRTPIPFLRKILPQKFTFIDDKVRLVGFYDWGYIGVHNNAYNYPVNFIQSVGFGTSISITDNVIFQIGAGIPLGAKKLEETPIRMYFSINAEVDKIFLKPKDRTKTTL